MRVQLMQINCWCVLNFKMHSKYDANNIHINFYDHCGYKNKILNYENVSAKISE